MPLSRLLKTQRQSHRCACSPLACWTWLALALLAAGTEAHADDPPTFADRPDEDVREIDRTFALLLNPLAMAVGVFGGEADIVLGRYAAVALEGGLYRHDDGAGEVLGAGLLVYPLASAFHHLYVEPRIVYARPFGEGFATVDWNADVLGLGGSAGWQWTWDYGFTMRLGAGAMYFLGAPRDGVYRGALGLGAQAVLDASVGWAF